MLVDVVCLRYKGEPRPRDEVKSAMRTRPVRGELQLDYARPGWYRGKRNAPLLAGLVVPGETRWALPPLDEARIIKVRGLDLVIQGIEEIYQNRRVVDSYRQAWWCRIVAGDPAAVRAPLDVRELVAG